jgi:CRP/FNR family transcriptional regulator, cyclic AMP receptor protein
MPVETTLAIFSTLSAALREPLAHACQLVEYPARTTIFQQNDPSSGIYGVLAGAVRLEVTTSSSDAALSSIMPPGQWLGDVSATDGRPQGYSAVTAVTSCCVALPQQAFEQLMKSIPEMGHQCLTWISTKERLMRGYLADANTLPLEQRFAKRLSALASAFGVRHGDGSVEIQIELTQQDLGHLLGATRQRMNQIMIDWRQRGLLASQHKRIVLLNAPAIRGIGGPLQPIVQEVLDNSRRFTTCLHYE